MKPFGSLGPNNKQVIPISPGIYVPGDSFLIPEVITNECFDGQ